MHPASLLLLFLPACTHSQAGSSDTEAEDQPSPCPTGYAGFELCNGVDDDGDGEVDEADAPDARPWFTDADGDDWGAPDSVVVACTQPAGTIDRGGDCDDGDPAIHPLVAERCNGIDDDCDSIVDESPEDGLFAYRDYDGDGWGKTIVYEDVDEEWEVGPLWCEMHDGYVTVGGDCEDGDAAIHPEAEEICGDGIDQDCDGSDEECAR